MSKASELDRKVKLYILENIDGENYGRELKTTAETINYDYIRARKLQAKITRLANMKASYKFRLAAITAADNRPGRLHQ